jgi:hypothetical protein
VGLPSISYANALYPSFGYREKKNPTEPRFPYSRHAFDPLALLSPAGPGPHSLRDLGLPRPLVIQVLAPHPDDSDAIALSLRHLQRQGQALHVAVLTTGASGVDPGFEGADDDDARAAAGRMDGRPAG